MKTDWFHLRRIPEPEVMDASCEVEAYASAAQEHLKDIDRTFVAHVGKLFGARTPMGRALDVGCGPGQIPILMASRWPELRIIGIDAAPGMIEEARRQAEQAGVAISFQTFRVTAPGDAQGKAGKLPFEAHSFDLVTCNSVLHHLSDPLAVLNEIARVARPDAAVLVRDLVRPSIFILPIHLAQHRRYYSGAMRKLYEASVRAAYTFSELEDLLERSDLAALSGISVFRHVGTHIGIERAAGGQSQVSE